MEYTYLFIWVCVCAYMIVSTDTLHISHVGSSMKIKKPALYLLGAYPIVIYQDTTRREYARFNCHMTPLPVRGQLSTHFKLVSGTINDIFQSISAAQAIESIYFFS